MAKKSKRAKGATTAASSEAVPKRRPRVSAEEWSRTVGIVGWKLLPKAARKRCLEARRDLKKSTRAAEAIEKARAKIEALQDSAVFTAGAAAYQVLQEIRDSSHKLLETLRCLAPAPVEQKAVPVAGTAPEQAATPDSGPAADPGRESAEAGAQQPEAASSVG